MQTTTLAAERDAAIAAAREAAEAIVRAERLGVSPPVKDLLRQASREAERRVASLTS